MSILTTDDIISEMVRTATANATDKERYYFTEALRALVRHAKAEQLLQMKQDVNRAIGKSIAKD